MDIALIILVVVGIFIAWGMLTKLFDAAEDEVSVLTATRKADHVKTLRDLDLTEADVKKAKANKKSLDSISFD